MNQHLKLKMFTAVRKYDEAEERKAIKKNYPHSIYLCAHCLRAVTDIENDINDGVDPETAIKNHSLGRFQTALLRCLK